MRQRKSPKSVGIVDYIIPTTWKRVVKVLRNRWMAYYKNPLILGKSSV